MAEVVLMPLMSDTMTEGVVAEWHKEVGDAVEMGDLLAEIETDKATMEFEAPEDGVLLFKADAGEPIPINAVLAIIGEEGESIEELLASSTGDSADDSPKTEQNQVEESTPIEHTSSEPTVEAVSPPTTDGRLKASPLAKKLAKEHHIDITTVKGSGDEGRIIKRDIEAYLANNKVETAPPSVETITPQVAASAPPPPPSTDPDAYEEVRVSQMRKTIARRLAESKFSAPHFYLRMEINMDNIIAWRKQMNELSEVKISFNDLIVKSCAMALRKHKAVNASWLGDKIRYNKHINIGVAVAVEEGLLVPVLRHADNKSLSDLATETRALAGKARDKKLAPEEMQGNTFSISNLGMFGIDEFTAIINPPDACILAVGRIKQTPVVVDGELKVTNIMAVTLSCDHRVVDGATGAQFLQTLKGLMEDPIRLLI